MTYSVEYWRDGQWHESRDATVPGKFLSEAERLAARRSQGGRIYRVRDGRRTLSKFQHGNQLTKEDNA